jgi:hypothetical protein
MNKHQKDQIITDINDLINEHESMTIGILSDSRNDLYQVFTELQSAAIQIGSRIEMLEGDRVPAVRILEQYCEMLYQYSISGDISASRFNDIKLTLVNILMDDIESIRNDIKTTYEIVFLPYKASMWDSLESIWLTAKEDERCSCRVIPIPYYDKNPDGSFGNMYCETDEFPEYVPIINYRDYSLTENKPDIIYFHNPYDRFNFVTSVHPSYYSSELKKCTNMLVYVPYFISGEKLPENLSETMGVFMADKVIVQSEPIKELYKKAYIDILGKEQKEKEASGGYHNLPFWKTLDKMAEDKFLPLGSPKIDKVLAYMKSKPDMPEEWEKIIRKRTGRQEEEGIEDIKIILYNTSISDLLTYREEAINKIRDVLQVFKNRTDAVLLWRPHPLNISAMQSMVPEILSSYIDIIEQYRREEFGIYDASADVHRAIALADAYYGDAHSSIVQMFGVTGKPVMLQNINILDMQKNSIGFDDFVFDGKFIWFSAIDHNGLYRMDINLKNIEYMGSFPREPQEGMRLFFACTKSDNNLIFAPFNADNIAIYDIKTGGFSSVSTRERVNPEDKVEKYNGIVSYKDKIFMLPCYYPSIDSYSVDKQALKTGYSWMGESSKQYKAISDLYYRRYLISEERYLIIPLCNMNAVLQYDMEEEKSLIFEVGESGYSYSGICYDGRYYWLSPRHDTPIVRWDKLNKNYTIYDKFPEEYENEKYSFIDSIYCAGYVWMFPLRSNMVLKINPNTGDIDCVSAFNRYLIPNKRKFHWVRTDGIKIYAGALRNNAILTYNPLSNEITENYIIYKKNEKDNLIYNAYNNYERDGMEDGVSYYSEANKVYLNNFISFCILRQSNISGAKNRALQNLSANSNGSCGEVIHKRICNIVEKVS